MRKWLGDSVRMAGALFYWNTRKTIYRLKRGSGGCPCQNPSDSGKPLETGCEAVIHWQRPARFRRVCPLLQQNDAGRWVCSVAAAQVRPFWGRVFGYVGGTIALLGLTAAITVFGVMRWIGYDVSPRQVVWPPAWAELRTVRAQLFIQQARDYYAHGQVKEALSALSVAHGLDRENYRVAIMLAQFYQVGNPTEADRMYADLLRERPEHHVETARVWFRSLLARGHLREIGDLAARQLPREPGQTAAWSHALVFAAERLQRADLLEKAADDEALSLHAREFFWLAGKVQTSSPDEAKSLLMTAPLVADFPYDRVYRVETLIALKFPGEAIALLGEFSSQMSGRDFARLTLAAYAEAGDEQRVGREFRALLDANKPLRAEVLALLATHLVRYPDANLLAMVTDALVRVPPDPWQARMEACLAVFCAAGVQKDGDRMGQAKKQMTEIVGRKDGGVTVLERFFLSGTRRPRLGNALAEQQNAMSLDLNYALLDKYLMKN
ncbi:hypothetical protein K0B96_11285 [Horticoccus luteus]|uniref:Tetratricopeptide repeat protein n=1 Tax=Horticoccus luteus TaxID=2862869 RepID=A0A8F9TU98_9BACT|nr:hypothetical protein [Horticoccus luteus]QYM77899.1 hypothetical protein K0B96_11285 [Horticoccus luteus]